MRLFGLVLAVALIGGCKSGGKDPADDTDETDTVPADDTDADTDGDTDPIDTPDDTDPADDTDDTDPPLDTDTDTPGSDTNDTAPVDTFNPDTTFVPDPETGDSGTGPGPGETGQDSAAPPPPCDPFEQLDCDGECFPITLLGDGTCHDGSLAGTPNFDCEDLGFDDGDCLGDTDDDPCPDPLDVRDCASRCYPLAWVGDGQCDDGTLYPPGDPNFMCALFSMDDGDCAVGP